MSTSTARLVKTEKKYTNFKNSICEIKDIEYTYDLFIRIGGDSLDLGSIYHKEMHFKDGKEYWEIFTSKAYFKFQILSRTEQKRIPLKQWKEMNKEEEVVDELKTKRARRDLDKILDDFLNQEFDFSLAEPPWKIDK